MEFSISFGDLNLSLSVSALVVAIVLRALRR